MITLELVSYIKLERSKSVPDSVIRSNLIANGWSESDVVEAMKAVVSPGVPQPPTTFTNLNKNGNKFLWTTFFILLVIDFIVIILFKVYQNNWGIFGISLQSIIIRLVVIYCVSAFAARGYMADKDKITSKNASYGILRAIGSLFVTIFIIIGVFFTGCMLLLYTGGLG